MTFLGADLSLVIKGKMQSGKNRVMITRTGHRYPTARFVEWRKMVGDQITAQLGRIEQPISIPVKATIRYWPADRIRRDATGICDALWHVFEHVGLVADDALIQAVDYRQMPIDKENPRAEIILMEMRGVS